MFGVGGEKDIERGRGGGGPEADHRLVRDIGRRGGEVGAGLRRESGAIDAARENLAVAAACGVMERGIDAAERAHAGARAIVNLTPAHHDHAVALRFQRRDGPRKQRLPAKRGQRLVAAEARGLAACEDRAEDHSAAS